MWLLRPSTRRTYDADLGLATSTAVVAGFVNVFSVMMFFAFSANVTGHAATLSEELVKGNWYQAWVVLAWMGLFLFGGFVANLSVSRLGGHNMVLGHAAPLVLQALVLAGVAHYGARHYLETLWETEVLVGMLLLSMGLQNGNVASVSNSVVRTTHLTGLFTDLGMELSLLMRPEGRKDARLRFRFTLHVSILFAYLLGGVLGGLLCHHWGFSALYLACGILLSVLARDLLMLWLRADHRADRTSKYPTTTT